MAKGGTTPQPVTGPKLKESVIVASQQQPKPQIRAKDPQTIADTSIVMN
jgi:hypothetical protein